MCFIVLQCASVCISVHECASVCFIVLALNSNIPFGCEKLQMADRSLMHMRTHDRFDVWIASSSRDSRNMSSPPTYKLLRLMTPGAEVDKVVFHEPDVRDNQYAIQVHSDLVITCAVDIQHALISPEHAPNAINNLVGGS